MSEAGHDDTDDDGYYAWLHSREQSSESGELSDDGHAILAAIDAFRARVLDPQAQHTPAEQEFINRVLPKKSGADPDMTAIELYLWFRRADDAKPKEAISRTAGVLGKSFAAIERDVRRKGGDKFDMGQGFDMRVHLYREGNRDPINLPRALRE